jgi:heme exporter protein C
VKAFPLLTALGAAAIFAAIYMVFWFAPMEAEMGAIQKIFYFHVSSAWLCFLGFLMSAVASAGYLWGKGPKWDLFALSSVELGLLFGLIVLITGPIWARPVWGVWWKWEPRLTTMLLLVLFYSAYWVLRVYGGESDGVRRFAAALGVFGAPNIYFVHIAVKKWRGQHPDVIQGGGLHPDMWKAVWVSFAALGLVFGLLLTLRYRVRRDERTVRTLRRRLARLGGQ